VTKSDRKYVPHLPTILAIGEANYTHMMRLLPDVDTEHLEYKFSAGKGLKYQIKIIDSARYTSTLEMRQLNTGVPSFLQPAMQIRLYHDARVAEVIKNQRIGGLRASYQYPNESMHQKNEKHLVNRFLAEWLHFCLLHQNEDSTSA
jgi:uncharacterized protein YqiB (DUF1249 family)